MHDRANRSLVLRCPAGEAGDICGILQDAGITVYNPVVAVTVEGTTTYKPVYAGYIFALEVHLALIVQAKARFGLPISFLSTMGVLSTVSQQELNTVSKFLRKLEQADEVDEVPAYAMAKMPTVAPAVQLELPLHDVGSVYTIKGGPFDGLSGIVETSTYVKLGVRLDSGSLMIM